MKEKPNILIKIKVKNKKKGDVKEKTISMNNILLEFRVLKILTFVLFLLQIGTSYLLYVFLKDNENNILLNIVFFYSLILNIMYLMGLFAEYNNKEDIEFRNFTKEIYKDIENLKEQYKEQLEIEVKNISLNLKEIEIE